MDFDDLQHDSLVVLCIASETENIAYIWKGIMFEDVSFEIILLNLFSKMMIKSSLNNP